MDHFSYRDGRLFAEGVEVDEIARHIGTPTYVYSAATLRLHARRFTQAFAPLAAHSHFAVKCCSNIHVLRVLAREGLGMDVVSAGELLRAFLAGAQPRDVVYAGVGKTEAEIRMALGDREALREALLPRGLTAPDNDSLNGGPSTNHALAAIGRCLAQLEPGPIAAFNVESESELMAIAQVAKSMNVRAGVAIRVNPDVKAGGHEYITTATSTSKFGVEPSAALAMLRRFGSDKHVAITGLHMHIGSSIVTTEPYAEAIGRMLELIDRAALPVGQGGAGVVIQSLDIGGGFGADYHTGDAPSAADFAAIIVPLLAARAKAGLRIMLEPGRTIAANAGVLLTRVVHIKESAGRKFVIVDAGMNTLIRPSLYEAFHFMWPTRVAPQHQPPRRIPAPDLPGLEPCDVVGPICESGDFFAKDRQLPAVAQGELMCIFAAGAYGMAMASHYNSHPLGAEVLVDGDEYEVVRAREGLADLVARELK